MTLRETKKYLNQHLCNSKITSKIRGLFEWNFAELHTNHSGNVRHCLKEVAEDCAWIVFTTDRGKLINLTLYTSESEACAEFIKEVREAYKDDWKD